MTGLQPGLNEQRLKAFCDIGQRTGALYILLLFTFLGCKRRRHRAGMSRKLCQGPRYTVQKYPLVHTVHTVLVSGGWCSCQCMSSACLCTHIYTRLGLKRHTDGDILLWSGGHHRDQPSCPGLRSFFDSSTSSLPSDRPICLVRADNEPVELTAEVSLTPSLLPKRSSRLTALSASARYDMAFHIRLVLQSAEMHVKDTWSHLNIILPVTCGGPLTLWYLVWSFDW